MEILNGAPLAERNTVTGFPNIPLNLSHDLASRLFIRACSLAGRPPWRVCVQ